MEVRRMIKGIDVSEYNGVIDWETVKNQGIQFAMIRLGIGSDIESQDDPQAVRNMSECTKLEIPFGVYIYSYALTEEDARSEAAHAIRMIQGFVPALGIFIDMEDADGYKVRHNLIPEENGETLTQFCQLFMDEVASASNRHIQTGTYANLNYFNNILNKESITGILWVAVWGPENCPVDWADVWQYSSDGVVEGNGSSRMDMNYWLNESAFIRLINQAAVRPEQILDTPTVEEEETADTKYHVGDTVSYNRIYTSSSAWGDGLNPLQTEGTITAVYSGARNPYLLNNGTGFINDACITETTEETSAAPTANKYVVVSGDTLSSIAVSFSTTVDQLLSLNLDITNPNLIWVGQVINVGEVTTEEPTEETHTYTIESGDTLGGIAQQFGTTVEALQEANNIEDPNLIIAGDTITIA